MGGGEGGGGMDGDGSRNRMSRTNSLYLSPGAPDKQKTVLLFHNKKKAQSFHLCLPSFYTPCKILVVEDNYKSAMSISFKKSTNLGTAIVDRVAAAGIFICRDEAKFTYF